MKIRILVVLVLWFLAALAFVGVGGLRVFPAPFPQVVLVGVLLALFGGYGLQPTFRAWLNSLPPSTVLALHLSRFVGFYFLILYRRGELPYDFAVLGGWGDIIVASLALLLLLAPIRVSSIRSPWLHGWNLLGLMDILFVVATAARLARFSPGSMAPITVLPLGLLPTFLVPLIIFTHSTLLIAGLHARRHAA